MNFKLVISLLLACIVYSVNIMAYSQTNEQKLELVLRDITNKQDYIDLANQYAKIDPIKYKALIYLLENTNNFSHSDYLLKSNETIKKRILLVDSLYFNLVKGKTYEEIKSREIEDSIKQLGKYIQSISWENIDEDQDLSFEHSPLINLSADKIRDHIDHCFFLRKTSPIIESISEDDFYKYVLAYQARYSRHISASSKDFYNILNKYIYCSLIDITESVKIYHLTIDNFREILGQYPLENKLGLL